MPDMKKQDGSGTVVGRRDVAKGVGVAPVLARRTAAAGRNARKVVQTGVIGKGATWGSRPLVSAVRKPKKESVRPVRLSLGNNLSKTPLGDRLKRVEKGVLSEVAQGLRMGGQGVAGPARSVAQGGAMKAGASTAAAGRAGLKAVKANPQAAGIGAAGGVLAGVAASKRPVAKRRYDPEDERRHRQGFYAGAGATGGALATGYGLTGIRRDTKRVMGTPDVPHPGDSPKTLSGWGKVAYEDLDDKGKARVDAENLKRTGAHRSQLLAHDAVHNLKNQKGTLLRRKPAALLAGGLAAMGGSAALQAHRREPRYT